MSGGENEKWYILVQSETLRCCKSWDGLGLWGFVVLRGDEGWAQRGGRWECGGKGIGGLTIRRVLRAVGGRRTAKGGWRGWERGLVGGLFVSRVARFATGERAVEAAEEIAALRRHWRDANATGSQTGELTEGIGGGL